jgi:uncharacterized protein (TIGR03032 family)
MTQSNAQSRPSLEITSSRQFSAWLGEQKSSLAFTTYQVGKVFFIGLQPTGKLSVFERNFDRCMGLWADSSRLYLSSLYQLWRFENALEPGQFHNGYDCMYVPQVGYVTGDLDVHDLAVDVSDKVVFVNTLFNCLATVSEKYSFIPLWQPPFISKLAAEDRCHLNGLAMREGKPNYVTVVSQSDVVDGWRDRRQDGGCLIDINSNEVILRGLTMPHSPRWDQGKLWLLNSGAGYFGYADLERGVFEPVTFCPGYLRGCALSVILPLLAHQKREEIRLFSGLALDENLRLRDAEPRCGLLVIDLRTGDIVHWLRIEGVVEELYDVVILPGVQRPMAVGFKN